ncbi:MAG: hypothetical protein WAO07_18285, partial [Desulfobacterales bacterium]
MKKRRVPVLQVIFDRENRRLPGNEVMGFPVATSTSWRRARMVMEIYAPAMHHLLDSLYRFG